MCQSDLTRNPRIPHVTLRFQPKITAQSVDSAGDLQSIISTVTYQYYDINEYRYLSERNGKAHLVSKSWQVSFLGLPP